MRVFAANKKAWQVETTVKQSSTWNGEEEKLKQNQKKKPGKEH